MFANKHAKILIALVCAVLGFMLATQFKTTERQKTINIQRAEDLSDRLKAVEKERDELSKEMEKLQAKAGDEVVAREIVRLKAFAGDFEMHGKGIKLVLDDSKIASKPGENPVLPLHLGEPHQLYQRRRDRSRNSRLRLYQTIGRRCRDCP